MVNPRDSRLVSSRRPRGGGDMRQARRRQAEPGTPSRDPAGRRFAGRRPAPRPTLLQWSPMRLCCAASSEPPPQLLLAGSLPDLPAPAARRFPASLCGSLLLPGWWLAPSPNSQRYAKLFPPKFLTLTSEIGDELVD